MAQHRMNCRRSGVRPAAETDASEPSTVARGVSVEEEFQPDVDLLGKPAGFGTEKSRTNQAFAVLDSYEVPDGSLGKVVECALSIESNGEAIVSVGGVEYGPYTGSVDIEIPLDGVVLTSGYQLRVLHQSTDGNSTTTKAQLTVVEV